MFPPKPFDRLEDLDAFRLFFKHVKRRIATLSGSSVRFIDAGHPRLWLRGGMQVDCDCGLCVRDISCECEQQQGTIPSMFAVCKVHYIVDISSSDRIAREHFRLNFLKHRF